MKNFKVSELCIVKPMKLYKTANIKKYGVPYDYYTIIAQTERIPEEVTKYATNIRKDEFHCLKKDITLVSKRDDEVCQDVFTNQTYPLYYPHGSIFYDPIIDDFAKEELVVSPSKVGTLYDYFTFTFRYNHGENSEEIKRLIYEDSFTIEELKTVKSNLIKDAQNKKIIYTHRYTDESLFKGNVLYDKRGNRIIPQDERTVEEKKLIILPKRKGSDL